MYGRTRCVVVKKDMHCSMMVIKRMNSNIIIFHVKASETFVDCSGSARTYVYEGEQQ
jgi:hypothetical protein